MEQQYNNQHSCNYCDKKYTRKSSYIKHTILCEVLHQTKREKQCEQEETTDIPSTRQIYTILQELAMKYQTMEQKMNDMQKWVETKKRKFNVIQWLHTNIQPTTTIELWIQSLQATEEHIEILIEHDMTQTISAILKKQLQTSSSSSCPSSSFPIYCLTQKSNLFYCYAPATNQVETNETNKTNEWRHFTTDEFIIMLKRIHGKLLKALCEWHDKNSNKIKQSDKMQILYNQTMIKLMSANFTQDSQILSKIKTELYHHLKKDFKNVVEFELEF